MSPIPWLEADDPFPPTTQAMHRPNGLLCAGGDLGTERLIAAYRRGIFPWFSENEPILWWSPDPRCVFFPAQFQASRSLCKFLRSNAMTLSFDHCFEHVMYLCSRPHLGPDASWISPNMIAAYTHLHHLGIAHSVEVWQSGELIGGLYGLSLGRCFFGESMFSLRSNGSKIALAALNRQLANWYYAILDCQVENPHLRSLGAQLIDRAHFTAILEQEADRTASPRSWQFDSDILEQVWHKR
jgi:leucyl/phenylalanyl-tRNA--protein transferase